MTALLTLTIAAGFWPGSSWQTFPYPDLEACRRDRPRIERMMTMFERPRLGQCVEVKRSDA